MSESTFLKLFFAAVLCIVLGAAYYARSVTPTELWHAKNLAKGNPLLETALGCMLGDGFLSYYEYGQFLKLAEQIR